MNKIIFLILLSLAQVFTPGTDASQQLATLLKQELAGKLKGVEVQMEVPAGAFLRHDRINEVKLTFDRLYIKPMMVRRAEITLEQMVLDPTKPPEAGVERVKSVGPLSYRFTFEADDLAAALAAKSKRIRNPKITIERGIATLSGKLKVGFIKTPFEVAGRPAFEKKSQIVYHVTEVKFIGVPLPASLKQLIEDDINPIFDLNEFYDKKKEELAQTERMLKRPLKFVVTELKAEHNRLLLTGTA